MRISRAISHKDSISHIMGCFSFSSLPFPSPPSSSLLPSFTPFLPLSVSLFLSSSFSYSPPTSFSLPFSPCSLFLLSFTLSCRTQSSYGVFTGERPLLSSLRTNFYLRTSMHRSWKFLVAHQVDEPFQHIWALLDTLTLSNGMGHTAAMTHQLVWLARPCQCQLEISSHP